MITNYHRPKTIQDAIKLLSSADENVKPLGGGTFVSQIKNHDFAVVDLQELGLDQITQAGNMLDVGGTTTLQTLMTYPDLPVAMKTALAKEVNFNLRQKATIAGSIVTGDGRSPIVTALLALDALLTWLPGPVEQGLGAFLLTRESGGPGKLISSVSIPLKAQLTFESVARTPADRPVLCVALARWPSGRMRIALGGFGQAPVTALDAPDAGGAEFAVRDALTRSGDSWASAEYRQESAAVLIKRMLATE